MADRADKKLDLLKKKRLREELGEKEVPKGEVKTIESMRVKDETIITEADAMDEDFIGEKEIDEFSKYFSGKTTPKILMTTNRRPKGVSKYDHNLFVGYFPLFKRNKNCLSKS